MTEATTAPVITPLASHPPQGPFQETFQCFTKRSAPNLQTLSSTHCTRNPNNHPIHASIPHPRCSTSTYLRLLCADVMQGETTLVVVQQTEVLVRLRNGYHICETQRPQLPCQLLRHWVSHSHPQSSQTTAHQHQSITPRNKVPNTLLSWHRCSKTISPLTHKPRRVALVSADLPVDGDQPLHHDGHHFTVRQSILQPVPQHHHQGQAFPLLVRPRRRLGGLANHNPQN
jgi:hypothetical protein